ncbi:hypothetical protein MSPGM_43980 [Methylorubrum sp. GM97]|nr:hypothetical protein MSPGM_43980 [Methylorubrum sp. GM97]
MKHAIAWLLGLAGGATGGVVGSMPAQAQDGLTCAIDLAIRDGMAEIQGIVVSQAGGKGTYQLIVMKAGRAGASNVSQGGRSHSNQAHGQALGL